MAEETPPENKTETAPADPAPVAGSPAESAPPQGAPAESAPAEAAPAEGAAAVAEGTGPAAAVLNEAGAQAMLDSLDDPAPAAPAAAPAAASAPVSAAPAEPPAAAATTADTAEIDDLLKQASFEDPSAVPAGGAAAPAADAEPFNLPAFEQVMNDAQVSSIDLLRDVELNVKIELGRNRMLVEDVLKLAEGSVVELDKLAGDPVDVFVNDRLVARGEVLVLNDNFCVRVNEIVAGAREEGM